MKGWNMQNIKYNAQIVFILVGVFTCAALYSCGRETYPPLPEALQAMQSDNAVEVTEVLVESWNNEPYYAFKPVASEPQKGFIFYPGAFVDPRAYAPPARLLAEAGFLVVIVKMPNDFAELGWDRADTVLSDFSSITTWAIGGHSMGGKMGCKYLKERQYPDNIPRLILWASRPSNDYRLDQTDIAALSVYGTNDGIVTDPILEESRQHLPDDTVWVEIVGGNHTQFGYYDTSPDPVQRNDNPADITLAEQQAIITAATNDFLQQL
jgi:pimeloyl-ACP methyl ester carboxylesterase